MTTRTIPWRWATRPSIASTTRGHSTAQNGRSTVGPLRGTSLRTEPASPSSIRPALESAPPGALAGKTVRASHVVLLLLSLPLLYFVLAYLYLAHWHESGWLFNTLMHENGRLTLLGSIFYF